MIVTKIEELSQSRSKIYIDNEFAFVLYKGELRLYKVRSGEELTEDNYRTIMEEVLPKRAKARAMNLLQGGDYTVHQLRLKLERGYYPTEVIDSALSYVAQFHYTDDLRYALNFITNNASARSRSRMTQDLRRRGIAQSVIEEAFLEWNEEGGEQDEVEMIRALLEKRHFDPESADLNEYRRQFAFLARRGFAPDKIRRVLYKSGAFDESL